MNKLTVRIANTKDQLDKCFKIRYSVFGDELGWETYNIENFPAERECDSFDCLSTTFNLLGQINGLLLPNVQVANKNSWKYGLPIERNYCLDNLPVDINKLGEIPRSSIIKEHRNSSNLALSLWSFAYSIAIKHGLTHLIAITNTEANFNKSHLMYEFLKNSNFVQENYDISQKNPIEEPKEFDDEKMFNILNNTNSQHFSVKNLPFALKIYLKAGCKLAGKPQYDRTYKRFVLPILWPIGDISQRQKKIIDRSLRDLPNNELLDV
jgi:L-ornithine Nalpha-acyltransferase